jgi:hypothetical protein
VLQVIGFNAKAVRTLGVTLALGAAAFCGSASAQVLSDQLQVISGSTTMTLTANQPTSGFESILAFANTTGGTDDSSTVNSIFVSGSGSTTTFNSTNASSWFTHQKTTTGTFFKETALTEPGTTTVSDVMLSFMAVVNGSNVNVIALISDPTLVADIVAMNAPTGTTPETGSFQNVTSLVFPGTAPFTVNVLSAVPEAGSWLLLLAGLGAAALAHRRRAELTPS